MVKISKLEMKNLNGGGYFGKRVECPECGDNQRRWDWRFIFWGKSTCRAWLASKHYNAVGSYISGTWVH